MVYIKKRVSRIKSKRSTKKHRSKSLKIRRMKRTRAKRSRLKGGAGSEYYTNMENSSPILDPIIKSIDDIKTILEFIRDIKRGNIRYLLCKIEQIKNYSCSKNTIYTKIFNKIINYGSIFTPMNLLNFESNDRDTILLKFLQLVVLQVLQFELLVFLIKKPIYVNNLLNNKQDILESITLVDINKFCTKFKLPPNTSCDKITSLNEKLTINPDMNLFDYLEQLYEEEEGYRF